MKRVFETKMYIIVSLVTLLIIVFDFSTLFENDKLNYTIGWGWDLSNLFWWFGGGIWIILIIYVLGYLVLKLLKRNSHYFLSICHIIFIMISIFSFSIGLGVYVYFLLISTIVFILNLIFSESRN